MKSKELIEKIIGGSYDSAELSDISSAVRSAQDINKQRTVAVMKATLRAGDKVILSGLRPKAINGLICTVGKINRTRVYVDMPTDSRAGRFSGSKSIGVPLSCVTKQ